MIPLRISQHILSTQLRPPIRLPYRMLNHIRLSTNVIATPRQDQTRRHTSRLDDLDLRIQRINSIQRTYVGRRVRAELVFVAAATPGKGERVVACVGVHVDYAGC